MAGSMGTIFENVIKVYHDELTGLKKPEKTLRCYTHGSLVPKEILRLPD
jgi:hypothetical protein